MSWLAPKISRSGFINVNPSTVIKILINKISVNALPRCCSASSRLCSPSFKEIRALVPIPTNIPNAKIIVIIGIVIPTPVNANPPTSGIFPIYIRSTMLYNVLTIIPIIAGTENCINNFEIFSSPKSFCLFIHFILLIWCICNYFNSNSY